MTYTYCKDRTDIDWTQVTGLLNGFGLTDLTPAQTQRLLRTVR